MKIINGITEDAQFASTLAEMSNEITELQNTGVDTTARASITSIEEEASNKSMVSLFRQNPKIVTLFDDPAVWDGANKVVTAEQYLTAGKSLKVTSVNAATTQVTVNFTGLDLLNGYLQFDVRGLDVANLQYVRVFAFASGGGYAQYTWYASDFAEGVWERCYLGIGGVRETLASLTGGLSSLTNVTSIRFDVRSNAETTVSVYLDKLLRLQNKLGKAFVTISFDDGNMTDLTVAKPIMDKYGFRGVSFNAHSMYSLSGHLDTAGMHFLYDAGWDIGSHTYTHINCETASDADISTDITSAYNWLIGEGFYRSTQILAYPHGTASVAGRNIARKFHTLGRGGMKGTGNPMAYQHLPVSDNLGISSICGDAMTVAAIKTQIDTAVMAKRWYNLFFHELKDGAPGVNMTPAGFEEIIAYIYGLGLEVYPYSDIVSGITEPLYAPKT